MKVPSENEGTKYLRNLKYYSCTVLSLSFKRKLQGQSMDLMHTLHFQGFHSNPSRTGKNLNKNPYFSLREKCPNTELVLVRIFLYSDGIRIFGHFSRSVYITFFCVYIKNKIPSALMKLKLLTFKFEKSVDCEILRNTVATFIQLFILLTLLSFLFCFRFFVFFVCVEERVMQIQLFFYTNH